ncbi:MAG TPA: permease, partial [Pilimelia sp.]|nr:permease [Pilimelia sp.]
AVGGAALAFPGAVAAVVAALAPAATSPEALRAAAAPVLAVSFLAVCVTLGYAALAQVAHRRIGVPLTVGAGLGALAVTAAAASAKGASLTDAWVGALLTLAAIMLVLAPSIDAGRRADRLLDGPDYAAAAVTAALVASLARVAWLLTPGTELVTAAALIAVVAAMVRVLPGDWRRGPALGIAVAGAVVAALAAYTAVPHAFRALAAPGPLWHGDLSAWPVGTPTDAWQAPVALVLLAVAAALALPRPASYDVAAGCVALATMAAPIALGLPWWSPVMLGGAVAAGYGTAAVVAREPRAGFSRAALAAAMALYAVGAGLVRPWTTAAALLLITLLGTVVAVLARVVNPLLDPPPVASVRQPGGAGSALLPPHLVRIAGAGLAGALLALPGAVAALVAGAGRPADTVLTAALAASGAALVAVVAVRRRLPQLLPYATLGIAGGATATAVASLFTPASTGMYAAAAALLGVVAELLRAQAHVAHRGAAAAGAVPAGDAAGGTAAPVAGGPDPAGGAVPAGGPRRWRVASARRSGEGTRVYGRLRRRLVPGPDGRWALSPSEGALAVAALPAGLAVFAIAPALGAALVDPYQALDRIWQGPPPVLLAPAAGGVGPTGVLAALLLTVAAALGAVGFRQRDLASAVPVILPGAAVTILIAPVALGAAWPAATTAALAVFALSMLGLALSPPPPDTERARPLRVARRVVFALGLAAGGAGLAGSLSTKPLTLFTLGGAVAVGLGAALWGRTEPARILGWLFGAVFAQLFVLTAGLVAGYPAAWSAFGVLGVGAALLVLPSALPRLRRPEALREAAAVEWSGHAAALLALALTHQSPRHVGALLAAWGAVLGISATRPHRSPTQRRVLFWAAVGCEITAWWLLMSIARVSLPEAYTLPFAALALLVGVLEVRQRPDLGSWMAYGPALIAAFAPTLFIVLTTEASATREVLLLLGAVAVLVAGSARRQQAPVMVGAVVTAIAALHALTVISSWLVLVPVGLVLLLLGASNEKRRHELQRLRGALGRMR